MEQHITFCEKTEIPDGILNRRMLAFDGDDGMMIFSVKGQLLVRTEKQAESNADHVLREGELLMLRSDHDCYLYPEEPVTFWQIRYRGDTPEGIPPFFTPYAPVRLLELIYLLDDYRKRFYPDDMLDTLLHLLLGEIRIQHDSGGRPDAPLFQRICEYINENSNRELTVGEIADHFHYSSRYVSRFFRRFDEAGIRSYITASRINHIKFLLLTTGMSLKEISEQLGFRDYKLFLKYYQYHEKMSPTEFRAVFSPKSPGMRSKKG